MFKKQLVLQLQIDFYTWCVLLSMQCHNVGENNSFCIELIKQN